VKRTALFDEHKKLGGRLIDFGGWELPVQYSGVAEEHLAVRNAVGLFDVSHMGEILVEGGDADRFLYHLVTNDVLRVQIGQAQYSPICRHDGGILDDLIIYRRAENRYLICVNASNTTRDFEWMKTVHHEGRFACRLENVSESWSQIAVQGPRSEKVLQGLTRASLAALKPFRFIEDWIAGVPAILARTGYTGEDGFEVYLPWAEAPAAWRLMLEKGAAHGIKPCGLGARDTLRLEMKYPLYGQELTEETHPLEAGLGWAVKLEKSDFVGKDALVRFQAEGLKRRLVGLELREAGIPRTGYRVFDETGNRDVGYVTSGTQSPSTKRSIGIAYVSEELSKIGSRLQVEIRSRKIPAEVVPTPFFQPKRMA
jgi:aminomethyltransferase